MARERDAAPAAFFCALTGKPGEAWERALLELEALFGPEVERLPPYPFSFTHYYEREMGRGLEKSLVVYRDRRPPGELADLKRKALEVERRLADAEGNRRVNLDPGYVTLAKVVLASAKDFSHRVCIGGGIYGEVTLKATAVGAWEALPWTYPDYRSESVQQFLWRARQALHGEAAREGGS